MNRGEGKHRAIELAPGEFVLQVSEPFKDPYGTIWNSFWRLRTNEPVVIRGAFVDLGMITVAELENA